MGAGILPILEAEVAGADPYSIEGKALAMNFEELDAIAEELDVPSISALGEPDEESDNSGEWFSSADGLATIQALIRYLKKTPGSIGDSERTIYDLEDCEEVLQKAALAGVRFRFTMLG